MTPSREAARTDDSRRTPDRRRVLLGAGGVAATALAGCLGSGASGSSGASIDADLPCFDSGGTNEPSQPLPTPVEGDPNADVTVAAYEDFACPHCREYYLNVVSELRDQYIEPGTIRYEHHDFPIPVARPASYTAANAARAAQARANDDAFWVYAEQLFENQDALGPDLYASIANAMCLGSEAVRTAAVNRKYEATVMGDRQRGLDRGVDATPTVFVNGTSVEPTVAAISSAIDSA